MDDSKWVKLTKDGHLIQVRANPWGVVLSADFTDVTRYYTPQKENLLARRAKKLAKAK